MRYTRHFSGSRIELSEPIVNVALVLNRHKRTELVGQSNKIIIIWFYNKDMLFLNQSSFDMYLLPIAFTQEKQICRVDFAYQFPVGVGISWDLVAFSQCLAWLLMEIQLARQFWHM